MSKKKNWHVVPAESKSALYYEGNTRKTVIKDTKAVAVNRVRQITEIKRQKS